MRRRRSAALLAVRFERRFERSREPKSRRLLDGRVSLLDKLEVDAARSERT